ncbi:hypothetical protein ISG33_11715 [Glaciecola sp. MH2013]|uniref:CBU_0592 family membrane protein n=1 Tax=Glaciecola sp. MH2013 TaxID=2785524 RepID=UPI0018A1071A|nr:hypothetical protein [Glaciecola sp. MH2013]MBF7074066.1 hypothetical protein [Glaciecola sp. MH2013]
MTLEVFLSYIGWAGTFLYLVNHAYISMMSNWKRTLYFGGNFLAATLLVVQSVYLASWQAVVINGFWMLVSICLLAGMSFDNIKIAAKHYYVVCVSLFVALISLSTLSLLSTGSWASTIQLFGWSSAFVFCSSYFLFSATRISSRAYLILNAYAAIALLPLLWEKQNWPVFALEVAWAAISIYGVAKSYQQVHLID